MLPLPPELSPLVTTAAEIVALGAFAIVTAIVLGRLVGQYLGVLFMLISFIATVTCLVGYMSFGLIGYNLTGRVAKAQGWATAGLVIAIMVVAEVGVLYGKLMGNSESGKRRGSTFFQRLYIGFCFASWIGHMSGGWVGLLTITASAVIIFWLSSYYLARFVLPPDENWSVSTALRCLLTFSTGSNYPYYVIEDREKVERVQGDQFRFTGPGIFLTGPDHVVAVSDAFAFKGARGPGVVFTQQYESIQEPMDLRPQQRAYPVEAITKDGIHVKVTAFGPFQLDVGAQRHVLGRPFPVRRSSVFKAFHARPMDIKRRKHGEEVTEERKQRRWDELYEIVGTCVMQDIIAEYEFNELCEPFDPEKDPRVGIAAEYQARMRQELSGYGISILGGGISNLLPADSEVVRRRIMSWQTQGQRKELERLGAAEAEAERLIGQTRAQVQAEMIENISEAIAEVTTDERESIVNTVILRFIESLNQMVTQPQLSERLPPSAARVLSDLPHIIGEE